MYVETGEVPLSLKAFRMLINFWYRISKLPEATLAKKALHENIAMRTNWVKTVEKILGSFGLTDAIESPCILKRKAKFSVKSKYTEFWSKALEEDNSSRLTFFRTVKNQFKFEEYLKGPIFEYRKAIAKLRCSDHPLEIETGRHKNIPRDNRICTLCPEREVETEDHFLTKCTFFARYKPRYNLCDTINSSTLVMDTNHFELGRYLAEALKERKKYKEWFNLN